MLVRRLAITLWKLAVITTIITTIITIITTIIIIIIIITITSITGYYISIYVYTINTHNYI